MVNKNTVRHLDENMKSEHGSHHTCSNRNNIKKVKFSQCFTKMKTMHGPITP